MKQNIGFTAALALCVLSFFAAVPVSAMLGRPSELRLTAQGGPDWWLGADSEPTPIRDTRHISVPGQVRTTQSANVVLHGYIGDSCQKLLSAKVEIDLAAQRITITPMTRREGEICQEIYRTFRQTISLGRLPEGRYLVETFDRGVSEMLTVVSDASAD